MQSIKFPGQIIAYKHLYLTSGSFWEVARVIKKGLVAFVLFADDLFLFFVYHSFAFSPSGTTGHFIFVAVLTIPTGYAGQRIGRIGEWVHQQQPTGKGIADHTCCQAITGETGYYSPLVNSTRHMTKAWLTAYKTACEGGKSGHQGADQSRSGDEQDGVVHFDDQY